MDEEQIKKIIDDTYDDSKENTLRSTLSKWYKRKLRSTAILFGLYCCFFYALGILSAILLFKADQTRFQIMYAAAFLFFMQRSALVKTMGSQRINKHGTDREIKRLELRIAELTETVKEK